MMNRKEFKKAIETTDRVCVFTRINTDISRCVKITKQEALNIAADMKHDDDFNEIDAFVSSDNELLIG